MTRCYEFYAKILKDPEFCDKSDSTVCRINKYVKFMQKQGIQFDKSPTDKARFIQLQLHAGATERAVTQPVSIVQEESIDSVPLITETPSEQPANIGESVEKCPVCQILPVNVQKQVDECIARATLSPEEAADLVKVVLETPKEELAKVLLTPRGAIYLLQQKKPETTVHAGAAEMQSAVSGFRACEFCHLSTTGGVVVEGKYFCKPEHAERAKQAGLFKQQKNEVKEWKPKETWAQRQAVMHPQHSKIEEALQVKLHEKGMHPLVDQEFCVKSTRPDFYFPDKKLAFYVDGSVVHVGKEDRDNLLRDMLAQRYGIRVVSISYTDFTDAETERVFQQILSE